MTTGGRWGWLSSRDHPFCLSVGVFLGQPKPSCEALTCFLTLSVLKGCRFALPWVVLAVNVFITLRNIEINHT